MILPWLFINMIYNVHNCNNSLMHIIKWIADVDMWIKTLQTNSLDLFGLWLRFPLYCVIYRCKIKFKKCEWCICIMKYFSKQRWLAALPEYQVSLSSMCMASTLHQWKIIWLKLISNFNSTVSNRDNIKRSTLWELIYQQMPKKVVTKLQKFGICSSLNPPPPFLWLCKTILKMTTKWSLCFIFMAKQLSFFVYVCDFEILYPFLLIGTTTVLNIHVLVSFAWCQRKFERRCVQNRDRRFISGQTFLIFKTIMILVWFLVIFITNVSNSKEKTSLKKGKHELWFLKDIGWLDITFKYETFTWVFC